MICSQCKSPVIRQIEVPLQGEVRRVSWACKCYRGGIVGAAVEFGNRPAAFDLGQMAFADPNKKSHWRVGPDTYYK